MISIFSIQSSFTDMSRFCIFLSSLLVLAATQQHAGLVLVQPYDEILFAGNATAPSVRVSRSSPDTLTINGNLVVTGTLTESPLILAMSNHAQPLAVWPSFTKLMIDQAVHGNWSTTQYQYTVPAAGYYRCTITGGIYYTVSVPNQYYGIGVMVNGVLTGFYAPQTLSVPTILNYAFQDIVYAPAGSAISFAGTSQVAGYTTIADGGLSFTVKISVQRVI